MKLGTRLSIIVLTAVIGGATAFYATDLFAPTKTVQVAQPARPAIGGAFTLTSHRGETITDQTFRGKVQLVFFGFTHCPDVCPTALYLVSDLLERLGPRAQDVKPIFITVDPERDTPDVLAGYVAAFHPSLVGLTGTPTQIAEAAQAFRAFYRKLPREDGDYFMEHSGSIYVMDRNGAFRGTLDIHETPEIAFDKLRRFLGPEATS